MASFNKVLILGNLGSDPEIAYTGSGLAVARFNVATNEVWIDQEGNQQQHTEWHRVVVWGKQAERCKEYLKKGSTVFVEGRLRTRQFEDRNSNKRVVVEVIAQRVQFIGTRGAVGAHEPAEVVADEIAQAPAPNGAIADDDVPF